MGENPESKNLKPRVLLATACRWFPTARLAIALANAGCTVTTVCPSDHPVSKTKAVQRIYRYRGLMPLTSFLSAIHAANPDFVIPCDDLATRHLHQLYYKSRKNDNAESRISTLIERSLGEPASFPIIFARAAFIELARAEGVRAPKTAGISNTEDLKRWLAEVGFPTVLKADSTSGGAGVSIVHNLEQAQRAMRRLKAPPLLARAAKRALVDGDTTLVWPSLLRRRFTVNAQMFIAGREATSAVACWKGAALASLHFEVLNKVNSAGHATVLRRIENAEMSSVAEKIARRLKFSGLLGLDFMLENDTQNAYLIEVNPRATQVGHLTLGSGNDLPAALYSALSGQPLQPAPKITDKEVIALFPHEWLRDAVSPFLRSGHHDVPWEEPDLVLACIKHGRTSWGASRRSWAQNLSAVPKL